MTYVANTTADQQAMLEAIGVEAVETLFNVVPEAARFPRLNLPRPLSEMEALAELARMAEANVDAHHYLWFLGAGAYNHFVPSVVPQLQMRSEFYTAYTPYQPEASQGTLQAIFEYQSMLAELTGMAVVNASHYDGATALAEAAIMSVNAARGNRPKILVSPNVHPQYREVMRTYLQGTPFTVTGDENPAHDLDALKEMLDEKTACLIVQSPNFFGELEAVDRLAEAVHAAGALFIMHIDPISLGLFKPPSHYGADIVTGEGQSLGNNLNFGGPYLGIFATTQKLIRKMPGRVVGQTTDTNGRRGYVLTLSTREQHIRREKATSNICTNQGLVALGAAIYLAAMGKQGLRRVAELCYHKAHYTAAEIDKLNGYAVINQRPFFKEFVVRCPKPALKIAQQLNQQKILPGYVLSRRFPDRPHDLLVCVTEMNSKAQIDRLVTALSEAA
ncbi:MAG: aminomethyl-transferring glycine dehydrogenase subunit GcvPA [Anaerolineae bacterium]|nr:aminomethyl-transferring glycine dehydrogenase subunit GcvPA [Anaerolineae bacterium]